MLLLVAYPYSLLQLNDDDEIEEACIYFVVLVSSPSTLLHLSKLFVVGLLVENINLLE